MNKWILLILSVILLSACEKEDEPVPGPQTAERTVMGWLAGDNNPSIIVGITENYYLCIA